MHKGQDMEPRPATPNRLTRDRRTHSQAVRPGIRRAPLVAALALVAIGAALISNPGRQQGSAPISHPVPIVWEQSPEASAGRGGGPAPASSVLPAATAQLSQPRPTATVSPVRPLAVPTMPPSSNGAPAPVRKPGTPNPDPSTDHVIVVDGDSGAVLFQRNGFVPIAPASLTKIMTAILGLEHGNIAEQVKVDVNAASLVDSTVMGLEPWFDVTLEDLLYGLMLPSGNDAALAIGRYVAGSDEAFVRLMNEKAAWLGLRSTHFANPHGLDDPDHYSSPADMVTMARYGMQYPVFRKLAAARYYDISRSNIAYTIYNLNPVLGAYPGADGVKIGYTDNAGRSIVASAVRNGHRVYVAFMQSQGGLVPDTTLLLDWAFNSFTWP